MIADEGSLRQHRAGKVEKMSTEKGPMIARGRTAEIFLWKDNQVLKLFLDWCPAHWIEEEVRGTQAAYETGLPVPAVERMVEVEGRLGIVFERIDGSSMLGLVGSKPWKLFRLARVLAELHAEMHSREVPELPSQRRSLKRAIQREDVLPVNTKEVVLKALEQLPDGSALCHGDFHPENIIMSSRGPIIIDWMAAKQGNPLADVARTWLLNRLGYLKAGIPERWLINPMRALFHSIYLRRYLQIRPGSRKQITAWLLPVAAARVAENIPEEKQRFLAFVEAKLKSQR